MALGGEAGINEKTHFHTTVALITERKEIELRGVWPLRSSKKRVLLWQLGDVLIELDQRGFARQMVSFGIL